MCQIPQGLAYGLLAAAVLREELGKNWGGGESEGGVSVKDRRRDATIKHHLLSYQICGADTVSLRAGIISLNGC